MYFVFCNIEVAMLATRVTLSRAILVMQLTISDITNSAEAELGHTAPSSRGTWCTVGHRGVLGHRPGIGAAVSDHPNRQEDVLQEQLHVLLLCWT